MAFLLSVSSSIGKRILLFGLRQIDLLDKDPSDFVDVAVGKRTTLEVRDVGLRVKKLVSLLHLKLPLEFHLSKARAALLRVTFVLDFGVPTIIVELEGVQVFAKISEKDDSTANAKSPGRAPDQERKSSTLEDSNSDVSSDGREQIPTVDDLTKSFLREEPAEEVRELEEALNTQSEYLQESTISSEDGDDESSVGMGGGLGLPAVLRNLLNTALDRLQISVKGISIQVDGTLQPESISSPTEEHPSVSINFHIARISIDGLPSENPKVDVTPIEASSADDARVQGKRRMRIESVCARLISNAESFASLAKVSRPASPVDVRSNASTRRKSESESSLSTKSSSHHEAPTHSAPKLSDQAVNPEESSAPSLSSPELSSGSDRLESSLLTIDEDRFADAASDDDGDSILDSSLRQPSQSMMEQSEQFPFSGQLGQSTEFDDDDGIIDYAVDNGLFASKHEESSDSRSSSPSQSLIWGDYERHSSPDLQEPRPHIAATTPTLSTPKSPANTPEKPSVSASEPRPASGLSLSTDNLDAAKHASVDTRRDSSGSSSASSRVEDLAQSKLFTHDEAESMYMSAMSAVPVKQSSEAIVPGGWDYRSDSSQEPDPVPILAGSRPSAKVGQATDADDECETPRPASRASIKSTPAPTSPVVGVAKPIAQVCRSQSTAETDTDNKVSKPFLTIDEIAVWFPLHLSEHSTTAEVDAGLSVDESTDQFPPAADLGEDSIFQGMPGSFSFYAESTARRTKNISGSVGTRKERTTPQLDKASATSQAHKSDRDSGIEVEVGTICGHVDISAGRMIFNLAQKVLGVLGGPTSPGKKEEKKQVEPSPSPDSSLNLSIRKLSVLWVEHLMTESIVEDEQMRAFFKLGEDPNQGILTANFSGIHAMTRTKTQESSLRLRLQKFVLASPGYEIVSFGARPRSRTSKAGPQNQLDHDVAVDVQQSSETRVVVDTRPVKISLDLQRLDEALSSFGGFSGMLELGNSITSNASLQNPPSPPSHQRARGVHFDRMPPPAIPATTPSQSPSLKVNIRFDDVFFLLKGKSCAVHLQTTPVKLVVRENNFRMQISDIRLSGPYLKLSNEDCSLVTTLKDTRVSFLFTPEEVDLAKLISIITPSKDPYEDDSDILMDTLLRQRQKGSVIRIEIGDVSVQVMDIQALRPFEDLGAEMARLSKVTKYLPEDDRPGILSLISVQKLDTDIMVNDRVGSVTLSCHNSSIAHVGLPSLLGLEVGKIVLSRQDETLIDEVVPLRPKDQFPMIMARMIGDEMEPRIKVKLFNVCFEYHVSTITAILGLPEEGTTDDVLAGIASSVATITGPTSPQTLSRQSTSGSNASTSFKSLELDLLLRKCALGLNPRKLKSKGLFVLSDARFSGAMPKKQDFSAILELRKASVHAIDDIDRIGSSATAGPHASLGSAFGDAQLEKLEEEGYVSLGNITGAKADVKVIGNGQEQPQIVNVEFTNEFLVLETCADSTQTLIAILNGLKPPLPPSTAQQYRTVVPLQEMMASFSGDAFVPETENADEAYIMDDADRVADEVPNNMEFVGSFYNPGSIPTEEDIGDSMLGEDDLQSLATPPVTRIRGERGLLESFQEQYEVAEGEKLDFDDNYFGSDSEIRGTARKWDSTRNQYHLSNEFKAPGSPFKLRVRDMNITWHLFDGYDWPRTREIIGQAVEDVEKRAEERRQKMGAHWDEEDDNVAVEEDFLFQSVWISIPVNEERGALARKINQEVVGDNYSETGSYATTAHTGSTIRPSSSHKSRRRRLKLERSRKRKIAFELQSVAVDLVVFPPSQGETQSSVNVRVNDFTIYDHVPTSTWRKFVTSLQAVHEREMGRPMINLELLTVKPVQDLAASELVMKVTVLPLRLHVDQDALDFITRFFEFKDDTVPESKEKGEQPFIQRLEVNTVKLKLDYKPKKVDYAGLRSGHTTEFMNFFILDSADITLRHAILYGITSFDKLHKTLNDVWMPDVKRNQLPGVLAGLAPVRNIVNVGKGVTDLVYVPVKEYKKDGRIVRSLQKGVFAFAKNTSSELARLGAKVAIGAQNVLEGAEGFLSPTSSAQRPSSDTGWEDIDPSSTEDFEEQRAVSNYANQPLGVMAGLRGAARHLERDLLTARDAVIAIPGEVMESGSAGGAARAVIRRAPTVVLRPALGATKAVSNTLFGVSNAIDKQNRRKIEDKYKNY